MSPRFNNLRHPLTGPTTGEAIGTGIGMLAGVIVLVIVGMVVASLFSVRPAKGCIVPLTPVAHGFETCGP